MKKEKIKLKRVAGAGILVASEHSLASFEEYEGEFDGDVQVQMAQMENVAGERLAQYRSICRASRAVLVVSTVLVCLERILDTVVW